MKVLVTGGAGFIGSFIVEEVMNNGWEPIVVDDLSTGNLSFVPKSVPFYNIDIRSATLEQVFRMHNPKVVIHQAAQVSVEFSTQQPLRDCEINTLGTLNILKLCAKYKVSKLIYASSAAVYGSAKEMPLKEEHHILPISFYGQSKYSAEQYIHLFHQLYGLPYAILRYSNVYGMRQNMLGEAGVVSIFINQAIRNKRITVYGDGSQTRDFIFVKDVAIANIQAVAFSGSGAFNISTNHPISLNELLAILQESIDQPLDITYTDSRVGDIKDSSLSFNKAREFLQWEPRTRFDIGLKETVTYYQTQVSK